MASSAVPIPVSALPLSEKPTGPAPLPGYLSPLQPLANVYNRYSSWRTSLGLPHPGTAENLQKEVKATHLTNYFFDGARADLTKSLSMNPAFQVTHSFALGSQTSAPSYNFGAVYANNNIFMQGGVDHDGNLSARLNQGWSANNISKVQMQLSQTPGHSMIQMEQDYQGLDYSANLKAINASPADLTGVYIGNYLQSVTKNFALGVESVYQRPAPELADLSHSLLARYQGSDKSWIATAQVQPAMGIVQATYYHRLSDKVDVAADVQVMAQPTRRDAVATLGAKWDLRMATFRAQVDSSGKVAVLLEQRFAPTFAFLVAGEIDHLKNSAKVGLGLMLESTSLTPEEMGMPPQPGYPY